MISQFNNITANDNKTLPVIYFVTPTYGRSVQIAELTRLGQTLVSVPALHWILVEDSNSCNPVIGNLLRRLGKCFLICFWWLLSHSTSPWRIHNPFKELKKNKFSYFFTGVSFTHLASEMPAQFLKHKIKPRGVANRRAALDWIRQNVNQGVLYFGDDDNTYDFRLFEEIRDTQNVSMFPVGLIGDYSVSAPVVSEASPLHAFYCTCASISLIILISRGKLLVFMIRGRLVVDSLLIWLVLLLISNCCTNIQMQLLFTKLAMKRILSWKIWLSVMMKFNPKLKTVPR